MRRNRQTVLGRKRLARRAARGFTILELLLVISTILFLLAIMIAASAMSQRTAMQRTTERMIDAVESAVVTYFQIYGQYPDLHDSWSKLGDDAPKLMSVVLYRTLYNEASGRALPGVMEGMIERETEDIDDVAGESILGEPYLVDGWRNRLHYVPFMPAGLKPNPSKSDEKEHATKWGMNGGVPLVYSWGPNGKGWDPEEIRSGSSANFKNMMYLSSKRDENEDNITNFRDIPREYVVFE